MRYLKQLALPAAAIAIGLAALSATASQPLMNETVNYSYDARGRLVKAEHSGSVNNNVVANYGYDKADNRANVNVTGAP